MLSVFSKGHSIKFKFNINFLVYSHINTLYLLAIKSVEVQTQSETPTRINYSYLSKKQ